MLTAKEVCQQLGIGRDKLRELIQSGELTAIRTSPAPKAPYRVSEEALADFIKRQTVKPAAS